MEYRTVNRNEKFLFIDVLWLEIESIDVAQRQTFFLTYCSCIYYYFCLTYSYNFIIYYD